MRDRDAASETTVREARADETARPPGAAVYATAVLFLTNFVAYLDRSALGLFVQPVKDSLGLSDGEIGLMLGAAFVATFTIAGLFMGRLVDRVNRRNLLFVCVLIWSLGTVATGFTQSALQMFVARMVVGVGEAALFPAAVSLIADYFTPERRGRPYGIFTTGLYAGSGASLLAIGAALPAVESWSRKLAVQDIALEPWRLVMLAMLVPGLVCMAALALMREPARRAEARPVGGGVPNSGHPWLDNARILLPHHLGLSLVTLSLYALNGWMPTALIRDYGFAPRDAGILYGTIVAATGMIGAAAGGVLADRASRRSGVEGRLRFAILCAAIGIAGFAMVWSAPNATIMLAGGIVAAVPLGASVVAGVMAMADLSPPHARGSITGVYFVFAGVIGTAGGPAIVGYASDALARTGASLGPIIGATGTISVLLGAACLALAAQRVRGQSPRISAISG